ncbi:DNA repair and recombination protein MUS53 [Naviculisporaceae sp. PSN 640]
MSTIKKETVPDDAAVEEDKEQYGTGTHTLEELDEQYPSRPRNIHKTLPFHELPLSLFNPLIECKPSSSGPPTSSGAARPIGGRRAFRGNAPSKVSYHEQRRHIIERFMSRWRNEVGPDFYPAMRLILPDKDRDRGVYGLKESTLGKLLVKVVKIDKNSADGYALMHWKLPGNARGGGGAQGGAANQGTAGDFAGRCFEVLSKRQMRITPGDMTIGEVNVELDKLAGASGESEQLPIFEKLYQRMNAEEMMWLVRIILKDMRVGATERTFLGLWHPDAEALFSVSSSLRRVCWELYDPQFRLQQQETGVTLMNCFQPQLAQFQMTSTFTKLVSNLGVNEDNPEFWIEEKLDGERMQMHMKEDSTVPGGFRFAFWSRKAKDYTYLYGSGLKDDNSALTRHLKDAFHPGVRELILDGEMITWDPEVDKIVPFGTLKTAALDQQKNPFQNGPRPLYRVFDILLLNGKTISGYPLWERHEALEAAVKGVPRRLEIHPYEKATSPDAVEPFLRKVVAEASEGLVLKNPRSVYQLNSRNNDWIKVKPEYMSEFGESLDCVIIGGYYGSGRRGGTLSSFLCGLRVSQNYISARGANKEKCLSFCKVGGGLKAEDYAEIRHHTEDKWHDWDSSNPPSEYIELGGGERFQYEKPDVWIRPSESVVISIKAASFGPSDQFAMGWTLRFPRFRKLRLDKAWDAGLDVDEFEILKSKANQEEQERKAMEMESRKRKPATKRARKDLVIAGAGVVIKSEEDADADVKLPPTPKRPKASSSSKKKHDKESHKLLFSGLHFCVLSESVKPTKMSKPDLESLIKQHGGTIHQKTSSSDEQQPPVILPISDKNVVRVASLKKAGKVDRVIRPKWIFDCLAQDNKRGFLLPFEAEHLLYGSEEALAAAEENTDRHGDSYARDIADLDELVSILENMKMRRHASSSSSEEDSEDSEDDDDEDHHKNDFSLEDFLNQLEEHGHLQSEDKKDLASFLFRHCQVYLALVSPEQPRPGSMPNINMNITAIKLKNYIQFGGGTITDNLQDNSTTHIVIVGGDNKNDENTPGISVRQRAAELRAEMSQKRGATKRMPRIVKQEWVEDCWKEGTLVDEEQYAVV